VRVIARRPDTIVGFGETRIHAETATFELRASEIPSPRPCDQLIADSQTFVVQGEPERRDPDRLVWTLARRPAGVSWPMSARRVDCGNGASFRTAMELLTLSAGSRALSPEGKVELSRLVPCGVTDHEITRDRDIVRCAKDTVAQWNFCYRQARN
jgi:hypothetical protein